MNTIKKILIPIDFSKSSSSAINYVIGLSKYDPRLICTLIHVVEKETSTELLASKESELNKIKSEHFDSNSINCDVLIEKGVLSNVLSNINAKLDIDLLVMGTAGSTSIDSISNTSELMSTLDYPALIIPEDFQSFKLNNIALALNEDKIVEPKRLSILHDVAKWHNSKVHILMVKKEKTTSKSSILNNKKTLDYYLDGLEYQYSVVENLDIELGLFNYASDNRIDMLAVLPKNHTSKNQPSSGHLTKALSLHSNKPLLLVN